jgi:hypothetical protein
VDEVTGHAILYLRYGFIFSAQYGHDAGC